MENVEGGFDVGTLGAHRDGLGLDDLGWIGGFDAVVE